MDLLDPNLRLIRIHSGFPNPTGTEVHSARANTSRNQCVQTQQFFHGIWGQQSPGFAESWRTKCSSDTHTHTYQTLEACLLPICSFPLTANKRIQYNFGRTYAFLKMLSVRWWLISLVFFNIAIRPSNAIRRIWITCRGLLTTDPPTAPRKRASIRSVSTLKSALWTGFRIHPIGSENSIRLVLVKMNVWYCAMV